MNFVIKKSQLLFYFNSVVETGISKYMSQRLFKRFYLILWNWFIQVHLTFLYFWLLAENIKLNLFLWQMLLKNIPRILIMITGTVAPFLLIWISKQNNLPLGTTHLHQLKHKGCFESTWVLLDISVCPFTLLIHESQNISKLSENGLIFTICNFCGRLESIKSWIIFLELSMCPLRKASDHGYGSCCVCVFGIYVTF